MDTDRTANILGTLASGPRTRQAIAKSLGFQGESHVLRLLRALEQQHHVKRIGQGKQTQWALPAYIPDSSGPKQMAAASGWATPFGKATQPKPAKGKGSWWAPFAAATVPRSGFVAAAEQRRRELVGEFVPRPDEGED